MHRDLVERRRWISEEEYKEGLALAQLAPGPLAAQLAIYLGYARHGLLGATLVGLAFPAPSFVMVLAAGWAYVTYQGLDWLQALFYGVGAAVIAIIAHQATKLTRRTLGRDRLLAAIFLVVAAVTVVTESENGLLILAAGVLVWLVRARPRRLRLPRPGRGLAALLVPLPAAVTAPAADPGVLWQIAGFFGQAGAFVFGSGLAIVPFLYGGVVGTYGWLTDRQFLDAVALALLTPARWSSPPGSSATWWPACPAPPSPPWPPSCPATCSPSSRPPGFAATASTPRSPRSWTGSPPGPSGPSPGQ
jgi:chromate transporter